MNARPERAMDLVIQPRRVVLVFLPNTNELQRFVLSGALDDLGRQYRLEYVFSSADAPTMRAAAPGIITDDNSHILDIPPKRFKIWVRLFEASCYLYADKSRSFALRVGSPRDSFEVRLLVLAWKLALRYLAPLLEKLPWTRARWTGRSSKYERLISDFLESDAFVNLFSQQAEKQKEAKDILASLAPHPPMVELLHKVEPLFSLIPTSLLDHYCGDLILAARAGDHVVVALQSGWDNMSSKGILHVQPHHVGVWGPQSKVHAKTIQGVAKANTALLGAPHYEALRPIPAEARADLRRRLGASTDERLILFGGSFRQFDETSVLKRLDAAISRGELGRTKVVYRPHPWRADRTDEDDFFKQRWKNIVFDPDMKERYIRSKTERGYLKHAPMYDMTYLAALLSSVDAVMSPMSTLLIESIIMDRPTMAIAFGDGKHPYHPGLSAKMTHFEGLDSSGALIWCDDSRRFESMAKTLAAQCGQPVDPEARAELLARVLAWNPEATYAHRLLTYCRDRVDVEGRIASQRRYGSRRKHMSQSYSALDIVKEYCGLEDADVDIPGYWMHGWIPGYHNQHHALIALHKKPGQTPGYDYLGQIEHEKDEVMQWVSRRDQADFLRAHGYRHVAAIGLPWGYLPREHVDRAPGSLLVLPPHGHGTHGAEDELAELYAEQIAAKAHLFSDVYVCLNADDYARNQWRPSFEKRGIPVIIGADQSEPNTLLRLRRMFSRFEFITTNGYGSHIAYAAAAGAKVSVYGPYADFPLPRIRKSHAVKMFPDLADLAYDLCTEAALREAYPFLFTDPERALELTDWGVREIGSDNLLSPEELKAAFGWGVSRIDHLQAPGRDALSIA